MNNKVALIILDGWGYGDGSKSDAIANANVPTFRSLIRQHPNSTLQTSGEQVGLPEGQMGNSEVGHLNIGAGRIVYQDLTLIQKEVREDKISDNKTFRAAIEHCLKHDCWLHLFGLVSEGGVHSSSSHLVKLVDIAYRSGLKKIAIHAFTDGRDTDPKSGLGYIEDLEKKIAHTPAVIASIIGRYYAMDRDKRWERVKLAYDLLVHGVGEGSVHLRNSIIKSYESGITDEFIKPIIHTHADGKPIALIRDNDAVISFNFRTDRCREITMALSQQDFPEHHMKALNLHYVTMTNYDSTFRNVHIMYDKDNLNMTLGEVVSIHGRTQIRIAETEKYPHVTFFFSGGREEIFPGERRIMVPSPKVATYDLKPEMSAVELTDAIVDEIRKDPADFICLNFANPDMVGHTGVFEAVVKAVETVDVCLKRILDAGSENGYDFIVIADHGNADYMMNADGSPNTAHTTNPVPCILISRKYNKIKNGKLADIAPTILKLMGLPTPSEMTGDCLI